MRSLLFVPADSERKLARASTIEADATVYDLEDSVLPDRKVVARQLLTAHLKAQPPSDRTWVRINGPESSELLNDLAVVIPLQPKGIVLPKITGPKDVQLVSNYLSMAEAIFGLAIESIKLIAVCTETPLAVLKMAELAEARIPRLRGLIWGAEDLSSALGASDPRGPDGAWRAAYLHARTQCLLAAHALDIMAIDTVFVDIRDSAGCTRSAIEARSDGFTGKIAIHPDQVSLINTVFTPTSEQLENARRIVKAFEEGQGAVLMDGKMLDIPHLKAARRVLSAAG